MLEKEDRPHEYIIVIDWEYLCFPNEIKSFRSGYIWCKVPFPENGVSVISGQPEKLIDTTLSF